MEKKVTPMIDHTEVLLVPKSDRPSGAIPAKDEIAIGKNSLIGARTNNIVKSPEKINVEIIRNHNAESLTLSSIITKLLR
jgi:hypothetical protein